MLTQQQRNNRRKRASTRQLAYLRERFLENPKPDQAHREAIGKAIDMTPRSVQIWFQNNRAKTKIQEQRLASHFPTFTTRINGNRSRVYYDSSRCSSPSNFYKYGEHSVSMPALRSNVPNHFNSDYSTRTSTPEVFDRDLMAFLDAPEPPSSDEWNEPSFFLQENNSFGDLGDNSPNLHFQCDSPCSEVYYLEESGVLPDKFASTTNLETPNSFSDRIDYSGDDTFIVIPCQSVQTLEMEIQSNIVKECIELEYSPLLEKLRVYFDPTCFSDEINQDYIRVMEMDVLEMVDYSNVHLHIKTTGTANFFAVDEEENFLPLEEDFTCQLCISTEYTFFGKFDLLTEDDLFKHTTACSMPKRSSFDLEKFMNHEVV